MATRQPGDYTVIVGRPEDQSASLVQLLQQAGFRTRSFPVLRIEALADPAAPQSTDAQTEQYRLAIRQKVMALDLYQHAIFISTNAVKYGFDWLDNYWPQYPQINWYAIGAATRAALDARGVHASSSKLGMDSESLLKLPALQALDEQKVLIFRGLGGREHLAESLRARGASVDYCECYRRVAIQPQVGALATALGDCQQPILLMSSSESLDIFTRLASAEALLARVLALPLLVPGQRLAAHARSLGYQCLIIARNAGQQASLEALQSWLTAAQ